MKKKILKTINEHNLIRENMHIVLGLSGGPDSVCLFHVLLQLAGEMNLKIHPVHINHKFRPGAAEEDQAYVEELCRAQCIECRSFVVDCNKIAAEEKLTSEEAGRKARYESFVKVAEELHAKGIAKEDIAIAVAQNSNDQCETILFRIMRGTGTDGLAGIAYSRTDESGYNIIRPLLDIERKEIEKYCGDCNLNPRIDHTNKETLYTRNKIRLELIPFLEENFNSNITQAVNRMGRSCAQDKDYLRAEGRKAFEAACASKGPVCRLFTEPLENLHSAVKFRVYSIALGEAGMRENVTEAHISAIEQVRLSQSPSASADLTGGFVVFKEYDKMVFCKAEHLDGAKCAEESSGWRLVKMTAAEYREFLREQAVEEGGNRVFGAFSGKVLETGPALEIRTRRDGDRIAIKGGTKKIQDLLVDCKVPKMFRDQLFMLASGSRILWVLPSEHFPDSTTRQKGRFSADFKVQPEDGETIIVLVK